jgi:methylthioribose-1-phosphate isomerase
VLTRSIRLAADGWAVEAIDQTWLPHELRFVRMESVEDAAAAIREMKVRGAPLIGATAGYGMALAMRRDPSALSMASASELLLLTRPTGVNLRWALEEMTRLLVGSPLEERASSAYRRAEEIADEDVQICRAIGEHGVQLLQQAAAARPVGEPVNVLTHCNAGWLATVDWGTALSPVYRAHDEGMPVHVWVSETRPRNQGAALTAWELGEQGVSHTVVPDNAAGHLLRSGRVDLVITGTDRTTAAGDVCNKIGTYLKAVAARHCGVPFFAAVPGPSIDWTLADPSAIPIEERGAEEVAEVRGLNRSGNIESVRIVPLASPVANFGFDITPASLVTALITERGVCPASAEGLASLYPEHGQND